MYPEIPASPPLMAPAQLRVARNGFEHAVNLVEKGDRFRNRLDPLCFGFRAPMQAAEGTNYHTAVFAVLTAMPYFKN